jgi:carbon storage regulator
MLIVRRRVGESIRIGDEIVVEILEVAHNRVKLGITAPKDVRVLRTEMEITREQNVMAAATTAEAAQTVLRFLSRRP